jgi:hypothetical protein
VRAELERAVVLRPELEPLRDEPERADVARREDDAARRDAVAREEPERDLVVRLVPELLREDEPERALVRRLPPELREELERAALVRRDVVRLRDVPPLLRSAAGISAFATALTSCGISRSRNFDIRSSSRRISFASFAVSLSPTWFASASIVL